MRAAYVAQMAPSSRITNCASFQTGDEMRRVQRIAYRTVQLAGSLLAAEALEAFADVTAEAPVPSDPGAVAARIADEDSRELGAVRER